MKICMNEEGEKNKGSEKNNSEVNRDNVLSSEDTIKNDDQIINQNKINSDSFTYSFIESNNCVDNNSKTKYKKQMISSSISNSIGNRNSIVKKHCWDYYGFIRIMITVIYFAVIIVSSSKINNSSDKNYVLSFSIIMIVYYALSFGIIQSILLSIYMHHYKNDVNYLFIGNINKLAKILLTSDYMLHMREIKDYITKELKINESNKAEKINDIDLYFIKFRKTNNYNFKLSNLLLLIFGIVAVIVMQDHFQIKNI